MSFQRCAAVHAILPEAFQTIPERWPHIDFAGRFYKHQRHCFFSPVNHFFVRSFNSIRAQWPFCTRRHNDCIGQKVRSQCEKALFQANSHCGRCEGGAALCQWWSHLYLQELVSYSGGGYSDTDCAAVTLPPERRHHFQILQPSRSGI